MSQSYGEPEGSESLNEIPPASPYTRSAENSNGPTGSNRSAGQAGAGSPPPFSNVPPQPGYSQPGYQPGFPPPWAYYAPPKQSNGCLTALKYFLFFILGFFLLMAVCQMIFGTIASSILSSASSLDLSSEWSNDKVSEKTLAGSRLSPAKVAILPIEGMITEDENGFVRRAIRTAYEDPKVKAIVLRVNSPGGTIAGSDYYYTLLKQLKNERKIPIIVSMGPTAASGGYYVSMVGDKIFAERSTMTGSIGVICMLFNAAGLCEKVGIGMNNITSGPNKGMGDFSKPMSDAERAIWQGVVDDAYRQFLGVVREGRPAFVEKPAEPAESAAPDDESTEEAAAPNAESAEKPAESAEKPEADKPQKSLEEIADGRIYTANEAKALGLIDEIGFLDDAVLAAIKSAGLDEGTTQVVRYKKTEGLAELLLSAEESGAEGKLGALAGTLSTPTVYYLTPGAVPVE